jgi:enoyl-CoA hydratase/carnithine racemase
VASIDPCLIDPAILRADWQGEAPPFACVELDDLGTDPGMLHLPPFPIIGIGDPSHPAARLVDTVVEAPVRLNLIVEQIARYPHAAGAAMQLLRGTEGLAVDHALTMESVCYAMLQGSAEHGRWIDAQPAAEMAPPGDIDFTRDGETLRIVMHRPGAQNAIDRPLRDALFEAFTVAALDPDITRVDLRATGRTFSIGADLAEFGTTRDPATAHQIRMQTLPAHPLSQCGPIVDAYVQGACIGSALEMVAFAGRITASPNAWFQLPELAMGVIPGAGGCVSIPRRIGRQRTALMLLSGKRIDSRTALRWGLIDAIVDKQPVDPGSAHTN